MNTTRLSIRTLGAIVLITCALAVIFPIPGFSVSSTAAQEPRETPTNEPTPTATNTATPTATPTQTPLPAPTLALVPTQGQAGVETWVTATGNWFTPGTAVTLYWDDMERPLESGVVGDNFQFTIVWATPTGPRATVGVHRILAIAADGRQAEAPFTLIQGPPTATRTPTLTPTATRTPTPSPTLRPVTPIVTISPLPRTATPTRPTATRTATALAGTATSTRTPSPTPGPGTPSATPQPKSTASPTPQAEIVDTGGGWGNLFLWGFVLAGLVVAFRLLRVRGLGSQS